MKSFLLSAITILILGFTINSSVEAQVLLKGTLTGSNFDVKIGGNYGGINYPGHSFTFIALSSNTGVSTLSINGGAPAPILKNVVQNLAAGDIKANQAVPVIFDGSNFQLLNQSATASAQWATSTVPNAIFYSTGRVGIGSSTPSARLDVIQSSSIETGMNLSTINTTSSIGLNLSVGSNGTTYGIKGALSGGLPTIGVDILSTSSNTAYGGRFMATDSSPTLAMGLFASGKAQGGTSYGIYSEATGSGINYGGFFKALGGTSNYGLIVSSGNVGIGTIAPSTTLDVVGNARFTGPVSITGLATGGATAAVGVNNLGQLVTIAGTATTQWVSTGTSTIYYSQPADAEKVVIGTPVLTPFYKMNIIGNNQPFLLSVANYNSSGSGGTMNLFRGDGALGSTTSLLANEELGSINFAGSVGTAGKSGARITGVSETAWSNSNTEARLEFSTAPTGSTVLGLNMVIKSGGNVGIGTGNPVAKLDVNGNSRITGLLTISGLATGGTTATVGVNSVGQLVTLAGTSNLWTVTGTALTPTTSTYGLNIGTIGGAGLMTIAATSKSAIIATSDIASNQGSIMAYNTSPVAGGAALAGFISGPNNVAVYGESSNISGVGIVANNIAGGQAFSATSTIAGLNSVATIKNLGTSGSALDIIVSNPSSTATGLSITVANSTASFAISASGKVQFNNYQNGTLTVDGAGNLGVAVTGASIPTGFSAFSSFDKVLNTSTTQIIFDSESYDKASAYNNGAGTYVAPTSGEYLFTVSSTTNNIGQVDLLLLKNNVVIKETRTSPSPNSGLYDSAQLTAMLDLTLGDVMTVVIRQYTGSTQTLYSLSGNGTVFSGKKIN